MTLNLFEQITEKTFELTNIFNEELLFSETSLVDIADAIDSKTFLENIADAIDPKIFSVDQLSESLQENSLAVETEVGANDFVDSLESSFTSFNFAESVYGSNTSINAFSSNSISNNAYNTSLNFAQTSNYGSTIIYQGDLGANWFTLDTRYNTTVISGNGNIHYGSGSSDLLDLSQISVSQLADWSFETFNLGNGDRLFDSLSLSNGYKILFEGIDKVVFSDYTYDLTVNPNDTYFGSQWNLHMMGVHNAWRFTTGSDDVLVGVQDSGLGVFNGSIHPDLKTTLIDSVNNYPDEFIENGQYKDSSHGTAVQGIIAAATNNGIGIAGINWNSDVFNIDVLGWDKPYNQDDLTLAQATQSMINYANSQGQRLVINMSLGGGSLDPNFVDLVDKNQNNALFVIATGNEGRSSISNPAVLAKYYDNVIAVGAVKDHGFRPSYSNYGEGITLMGPTEVLSTGAFPNKVFDYHTDFSGTSAATPNVAGIASLVWSANPNLSASQIKSILSETAYDLGNPGYDWEYGHGFVNADAAVRRAVALSYQDNLTGASSNSSFSATNYSTDDLGQANVESFSASNYHNQASLEEDLTLFTQQVLDEYYLESLENTTINFGSSNSDETIAVAEDYFYEGFSSNIHSGLSDIVIRNDL